MTDTPTPESILAQAQDAIVPSTNIDGWTGARQKRFLECIADGEPVRVACHRVHLSAASAYAFRRRPKGRAFDLGWKAADLLARERVAADLLDRAMEGQEITIDRAYGSTFSRHYQDNRLAVQMLNRLDRYADASDRTAPGHAARMVAADFESYLDLVGAEGGPARAGLFMLARNVDGENPQAELAPVIALARADRALRCGTLATDIDVADLDPACRADWTAEQWARAEASGLLVLAPPPAPEPEPAPEAPAATCQPVSTSAPAPAPDDPIWFDDSANQWRTHFPPPEDFDGDEEGEWADPDYERELMPEDLALLGLDQPGSDEDFARAEAERDAWFAANAVRERAPANERPNDGDTVGTDDDRPGAGEPLPIAPQEQAEHPTAPPVDAARACDHG